jgi:CHAD domain-containing protein
VQHNAVKFKSLLDRMNDPVRKLRKFLKKAPKCPAPEEVHDLRISALRVETVLVALRLDSCGNEKHLLRNLACVRRCAGKVRDMDVLTGYAATVHADSEQDCLVQLLENLGARRSKQARRLHRLVLRYGPALRRRLKRSHARVQRVLKVNRQS